MVLLWQANLEKHYPQQDYLNSEKENLQVNDTFPSYFDSYFFHHPSQMKNIYIHDTNIHTRTDGQSIDRLKHDFRSKYGFNIYGLNLLSFWLVAYHLLKNCYLLLMKFLHNLLHSAILVNFSILFNCNLDLLPSSTLSKPWITVLNNVTQKWLLM